jgi:D-arabinose 1-dehydrogenase-like Zn-dependent alcohol dehydrogenase
MRPSHQPGADLRRVFIRRLKVFGSTLGNLAEFRDLLALCERSPIRPVSVLDCERRVSADRDFSRLPFRGYLKRQVLLPEG